MSKNAERITQFTFHRSAVGVDPHPAPMAGAAICLPVTSTHGTSFGREALVRATSSTVDLAADCDERQVPRIHRIRFRSCLRPIDARCRVEAVEMQTDAGIELLRHERIERFCSTTAKFTAGRIIHKENGHRQTCLLGIACRRKGGLRRLAQTPT